MTVLPRRVRPMMALPRRELPADEERYGWELKWDGVRAVAYAERGLTDESLVLEGTLTEEFGREATARMLDDRSPVTAIVAGGNQLVSGALAELRARDVRVGDDISLVSCDAISVTEFFTPPIAVVRRDNRELGRKAAQLLLEQMRDDLAPRQIVLPTEFVRRASCAPPPARQPS